MNAIRKMFSRVKGGRLIANTAAPVVSLIVSDVPGDDPAQVASGPTVPCASGRKEALAAVARYNIALPPRLAAYLATAPAPPKPTDRAFLKNEVHVIASAARSLAAAADIAKAEGWLVDILGDDLEGESQHPRHGACQARIWPSPQKAPASSSRAAKQQLHFKHKGRHGGRNTEYLLAFALGIEGTAQGSTLWRQTPTA